MKSLSSELEDLNMQKRMIGIAFFTLAAMVSIGVIVWTLIPKKSCDDTIRSSTTDSSQSSTMSDEEAVETTTSSQTVSEKSKQDVTSYEKGTDSRHSFTVNVLLAPYGYNVEGDYVLEIAKADDVHSKPTSHLDKSDNIFYSAAVIDGITEIRLDNGKYAVCVYPEDEPDNFKRYEWIITDATTDKDLVLIVTEKVEPDQLMIVLHWGEQPRDIDGYLVGEGDFVHYWGKIGKHARLDIDSRQGNGIECITVTDPKGEFTYYIDDYSNEVPLNKSRAVVQIFRSDTRSPETFTVPDNIKEVWTVFSMKDGIVTEIGEEGPVICPEKK